MSSTVASIPASARTTARTAFGTFDLANPRVEDVSIRDVAHHLARINRYNGATPHPYSVAQHSLLCAELVRTWGGSASEQLEALLHDAPEAYYGDITYPMLCAIEQLGGRDALKRLRGGVDSVVRAAFGLAIDEPKIVREADVAALWLERDAFFGSEAWELGRMRNPNMGATDVRDYWLTECRWRDVEDRFGSRYNALACESRGWTLWVPPAASSARCSPTGQ